MMKQLIAGVLLWVATALAGVAIAHDYRYGGRHYYAPPPVVVYPPPRVVVPYVYHDYGYRHRHAYRPPPVRYYVDPYTGALVPVYPRRYYP
jgi:hypothetical protein